MTGTAVALSAAVLEGKYVDVLLSETTEGLIQEFVAELLRSDEDITHTAQPPNSQASGESLSDRLSVAIAAFNAFLQVNVTGPVLEGTHRLEALFSKAAKESKKSLYELRQACFRSLEVDGISPYAFIPNIEVFCLARAILFGFAADARGYKLELSLPAAEGGQAEAEPYTHPNIQWLLLRIHVWHHKLLTQPNLGPGSTFSRSSHWTDLPSLQEIIERELESTNKLILQSDDGAWTTTDKVNFLLEKANVMLALGKDATAREVLKAAAEMHNFVYTLSGALGKRTKFQEKSTSLLVVLAKSNAVDASTVVPTTEQARPQALLLNNDTLLENLEFNKDQEKTEADKANISAALADLSPDDQPQLSPLDQVLLLTEATLKDAFSPADSLTSEEVLPFAVRVLSDKSTNWQIYTQALLVRSRIEVHRSRTMERGILQMQAVVDQVLVDTTAPAGETENQSEVPSASSDEADVPTIQLTTPETSTSEILVPKPTSFFPAATASETAPARVRLQYIHVLNSPPKWHLESELAFAWAGVGSLASALEIFYRLRLWAEVALCHASRAAAEDEDGRGSGGEQKAKTILRWQLFHRTADANGPNAPRPDESHDLDVSKFTPADFQGPPRDPAPPNAPRLLCILGDIENDRTHYQRAWGISKHRYARAQTALGELFIREKHWEEARAAYRLAVGVNRLNPDMWNRLGDINLRLGDFSEAASAFRRSIAIAGDAVGTEDARTWSNLGSALYSLYVERIKEQNEQKGVDKDAAEPKAATNALDEEADDATAESTAQQSPSELLSQSLAAYRRGASLSLDNWQIWDNVITLGARLRPPAIADILLAMRHVIRIRNTEDALDIEVLRLLLNDVLLSKEKPGSETGVYQPPRGTPEKAVCDLLEDAVVPLITTRSELWELIARERVWRRDYAGAVDASERAWRAAIGSVGAGLLPGAGTGADAQSNWLENKEAWETVVERTDDLVSILENYGEDVPEIGSKWKAKARSAIRSVLGKAKDSWEDSDGWNRLKDLQEGLR